jgi:hypothetical protein
MKMVVVNDPDDFGLSDGAEVVDRLAVIKAGHDPHICVPRVMVDHGDLHWLIEEVGRLRADVRMLNFGELVGRDDVPQAEM